MSIHVKNDAYTNKSRCTYVHNICQLLSPGCFLFLAWCENMTCNNACNPDEISNLSL